MLPGQDPNAVPGPAPGIAPIAASSPSGPVPALPAAVPVAAVPAVPDASAPVLGAVVAPPATAPDAARAIGIAQGEANTKIAAAEDEAAKERLAQIKQEQDFAAAHSIAMREAQDETAQAFKRAQEMEPTGFWDGKGGKQVHAAIAVGLGRVAQVLGHLANNSAADIIQKATDDHFRDEKAKIDRAYQYAAARGKLTNDMRDQYAQEMLNLQAAHTATMTAAAEKIRAITAASQGKIDVAKADLEAKKLEATAAKDLQEQANNRAKIKLEGAQTAKEFADIQLKKSELKIKQDEEARKQAADAAKLDAAKTKSTAGDVKEFEKRAAKVEGLLEGTAKSPGAMMLYRNTDALSNELTAAIKSGDKARATAAVLAIEQGSRALSGSSPTQTSTHLLTQNLKSFGDYLNEQWGRLIGNPTATPEYVKRLKGLVDMAKQEKLDIAKATVRDFETKELDEKSGVSRGTPHEEYAKKRIEGFKQAYSGAGGGESGKTVTLVNKKTGERKTVSEDEARKMGAIK